MAKSQERCFKEREANTSQLNRLDGLTFFFAYFPISAVLRRLCFLFEKASARKLLLNFHLLLRF